MRNGYFNIDYLREPEFGKGTGLGLGLTALGDSLGKLGAIGANRQKIDDEKAQAAFDQKLKTDTFNFSKQQHADNMAADKEKLNWDMQKDKEDRKFKEYELKENLLRKDKELELQEVHNKALAGYYGAQAQNQALVRQEHMDKLAQEKADRKANVAVYRQMFPNETKGKSDDEVFALGQIMQKLSSKKAGDSSANEDKIKVNADFYKEYSHLGVVESRKDGFWADKDFVDELSNLAEQNQKQQQQNADYKKRQRELSKSKPLIFGDGAM